MDFGNVLRSHELTTDERDAPNAERQQMILDNMGLVHMIAKRLWNAGWEAADRLTYADLVSRGTLGLIFAVDKFEPERGFKFSTYAYKCIWGYMHSRERLEAPNEWREAEYTQRHTGERTWPSTVTTDFSGTDSPYDNDNGFSSREAKALVRATQIKGEESHNNIQTRMEELELDGVLDLVREAVASLEDRDSVIISRRFFDRMTLQQIGTELGLSRERIRQLEARSLARLRCKLLEHARAGTLDTDEVLVSLASGL